MAETGLVGSDNMAFLVATTGIIATVKRLHNHPGATAQQRRGWHGV